ncbi:hypothetical protein PsYK624_034160 [Phanerochaete sordida]|uniref:Uncharacterized protein n=1 Tax=Phanerochaete sordida TaxID=48140 RepID=A0A9P3G1K7_9APHY|nr:hypothetical protein PsYK624_034160 [Phanerochaete sordida]
MSLRHALEVGNQFRRPPADIHTQPGHGYWQWAPMHWLFDAVPGGENALLAAPHAASMTFSHLLHIYAAVDPLRDWRNRLPSARRVLYRVRQSASQVLVASAFSCGLTVTQHAFEGTDLIWLSTSSHSCADTVPHVAIIAVTSTIMTLIFHPVMTGLPNAR